MARSLAASALLALVALLAGCGKREPDLTPEQQMNAIMEANSPFAAAEIRMDEAMNKAVGTSVGDSWARKMIEHHRGAIAIARQALVMDPDPHVAAMAHATMEEETGELARLQKLVSGGAPVRASADLYQPAIDQIHQGMMAANGTGLAETFHRKMLELHKGAVVLANVALANGITDALRHEIERDKADHQKQVEAINAMLRNGIKPAAANSTAVPGSRNSPAAQRPAEAQRRRDGRDAAPASQ